MSLREGGKIDKRLSGKLMNLVIINPAMMALSLVVVCYLYFDPLSTTNQDNYSVFIVSVEMSSSLIIPRNMAIPNQQTTRFYSRDGRRILP